MLAKKKKTTKKKKRKTCSSIIKPFLAGTQIFFFFFFADTLNDWLAITLPRIKSHFQATIGQMKANLLIELRNIQMNAI